MTPKNVAIESQELLERAAKVAAAEGKTVDELTTEALERELARRSLEKFERAAKIRRGTYTDKEVEGIVETAVHESRAEQRGR